MHGLVYELYQNLEYFQDFALLLSKHFSTLEDCVGLHFIGTPK